MTCSGMRRAICCCRRRQVRDRALNQNQMMARLGGDEFAIILPGISGPSSAGRVAEISWRRCGRKTPAPPPRLLFRAALESRFARAMRPIVRGCSAMRTRRFMRQGGRARHLSLLRGENGRGSARPPAVEHDLRHAISRRELSLVYQPQQDVKSGEVVGFEALLRWKQCDPWRHIAGRFHSGRGGQRFDPADRRMGFARGLP